MEKSIMEVNMENGISMFQTVLDKGHVEYIDHMGSDLTVVNAARVSFNKESVWENPDSDDPLTLYPKDKKLIAYLAEHNHWTPFAHPQISLRIKAPIFVRAQLGKHQVGFVMNEVSRRYVKDTPDYYIPKWRGAPTDGAKQGSSDFVENPYFTQLFDACCSAAVLTYEELLGMGVAPEQARSALPQAMYTEWWWTGSLAAWARVYALRIDEHTQWETRQYAEAMGKIIEPLFPESWKALTSKR
jgi:thymidylate synthase (FAD)